MTFPVAVRANEIWDTDDSHSLLKRSCAGIKPQIFSKDRKLMLVLLRKIQRKGLCPIFGGIQGTENSSRNQDPMIVTAEQEESQREKAQKSRSSWESTQILTRKLDFSQWEGGSSLWIRS